MNALTDDAGTGGDAETTRAPTIWSTGAPCTNALPRYGEEEGGDGDVETTQVFRQIPTHLPRPASWRERLRKRITPRGGPRAPRGGGSISPATRPAVRD